MKLTQILSLKGYKTIRRYRNFVISQICANKRKVYYDRRYRWDRRMKKKCAYCGKEIEEDFRLGQYDGPWLCSEECERRWIEEKENEQKEMRQNKLRKY